MGVGTIFSRGALGDFS